ncbi:hypothetical protein ASG03_19210 [Rhizobium sp. Leaf341]|nr:hypothetical protein ASG03_19210 [Rhizobium sp. Leaf341]
MSDNSPEMRSRVYEKARGAVRRQLESMKPRPSDEMIDRQMGKLETAITEVEASHAAAPALDAAPAAATATAAAVAVAPAVVPVETMPETVPEPAPETMPEPVPREPLPVDVASPAAAPAEVTFQQPSVPYDVTHVAPEEPVEAAPIAAEPVDAFAPRPVDEAPASEEQAYEEPAYEEPVDQAPSHEEPAYQEPSYREPATDAGYADEPADIAEAPQPIEPDVYHAPAFEPVRAPGDDRDLPDAEPDAVEDFAYLNEPASQPDDRTAEPVDAPIDPPTDAVADENDMVALEPEPVEEPAQDWADEHDRAPEPASAEPHAIEPEHPSYEPVAFEPVSREPDAYEPVAHEPVAYEPVSYEPAFHEAAPLVEPDAETRDASAMPSATWDLPEWNEAPAGPVAAPDAEPVATQTYELAPELAATPVTAHIEPVWTESVETHPAEQAADPHDDWRTEPVSGDDRGDAVDATPLVLPAVSGGLTPEGEPSHSWALDETDPFQQEVRPEGTEPAVSDWSWPVDRSNETERTEAGDEPPPPQNWDEIDSLLAAGGAAAAAQGRAALDPAEAPAAPRRPASYRAEPRKSAFSIKRVVSVLVLLLVFGGGGYAYWMSRDAVNSWISDTIASLNTAPPTASNGGTSASGTGAPASGTAASGSATTDVASAEPNNKFTQRLQTDGSEVDEGAAQPPAGESAAQEGKSVAAQTEASRPVDTADASATPPAQGNAATTTDASPAATPDTTPSTTPAATPGTSPDAAAAGADAASAQTPPVTPTGAPDQATTQMPAGAQKMFLYEERLGQTAPTAIEGSVAWSLKEEAPEAGQRPEPVIQAQITVPDRGLTALMTIKRNTDTSLPASHTIEFVFSLPENFEGGSIDSVQRVAMKRNEQDRGDPLIAVPAKITDDFHMIALNDFPEAVTTNLDLLRTRAWIDIPLSYRNGRRALLTLEKGTAGTDAFNQALTAWSQARPAGN